MRTLELLNQHILYGYHSMKLPHVIYRFTGKANVKGKVVESARSAIDIEACVFDDYDVNKDTTLNKNNGKIRIITDFELREDDSLNNAQGDQIEYKGQLYTVKSVNKYSGYGDFLDAVAERLDKR